MSGEKRVKLNLTNSYNRASNITPNANWTPQTGQKSNFLFVRDAESATVASRSLIDELSVQKSSKKSSAEETVRPAKRDRRIFRDLLVKKLAKDTSNLSGEVEIDVLRYYYYIQVNRSNLFKKFLEFRRKIIFFIFHFN